MGNKNTTVFISIAVVMTALIVGGGIYFWQHPQLSKSESENLQQRTQLNELSQQKNEMQGQIDSLNTQLNELSQQKNEMQGQINNLNTQLHPPAPERYIKVVAPKGGETLCLNSSFIIRWESKGVNLVTLSVAVKEAGSSGSYIIGTFPATSSETGKAGEGEYVWNIGHTRGVVLPEGYNYKIEIDSADGTSVGGISDTYFEISTCKG